MDGCQRLKFKRGRTHADIGGCDRAGLKRKQAAYIDGGKQPAPGRSRPGLPQECFGKPPILLRLVRSAVGLRVLDDVLYKRCRQGLCTPRRRRRQKGRTIGLTQALSLHPHGQADTVDFVLGVVMESGTQFVRVSDVLAMTGVLRATLSRLLQRDQFPAPLKLGGLRVLASSRDDVEAWLGERR